MLRLIAICTLLGGGWAGMKLERALHEDRCLDAGGRIDARGLCSGQTP
ncbi:hypothetical protein Ga0609869_000817 [Rhodovulum iodosum]|uniref:Uncharacterized protein n=1 Tax=Rhodovulum iodosum TaxID=68291 RepID=A0ABV3XQH5_9RHOB|nr:hypothetical protein [Rhodovulum robiginosum]